MSLKKILLVEDSPDDQYIGETMLRRTLGDVEVVFAFDGLEALEILGKEDYRPDVILLDINMPRMNGLEFLKAYGGESDPLIPPVVVMLTSSEQASDKSESLSYNCVKQYIVKPMKKEDIEKLSEMLASLCD
jgi:CheY-like chemotaxis protein